MQKVDKFYEKCNTYEGGLEAFRQVLCKSFNLKKQ
jgi:hypothetical protein